MFISLLLVSTLAFLNGTIADLLEPVKECVPTATVQGPNHVCVCSHDGVFHCRLRNNVDGSVETMRPKKNCIPKYVYRLDKLFCRCSNKGFWLSKKCDATFTYLFSIYNIPSENFTTNISCTANNLYLIDCNICRCSADGIIDIKLCTTRFCGQGHKAESCSYGDILRVDDQLCACSDIDVYIDRLCINILDEVIQPIEKNDIIKLADTGKANRRVPWIATSVCDAAVVYTVDCNNCLCVEGRLVCAKEICVQQKKSANLRLRVNEIDSLPELKSDLLGSKVICEPGKKYRKDCNICTCTKDSTPSCTTMVCLHNYVIDIKALRGLLASG